MTLKPKTLNQIDALVFDMDGVLVDVSRSYRAAIIRTVNIFFSQGMRLPADGDTPLLTPDDVSLLKNAGGFNNDWDLTTAFIIYFLELLPPLPVSTLPLRRRISTLLAYLQIVSHGDPPLTMDELRTRKNIAELAEKVSRAGGGLSALGKVLTGNNRHLAFGHGNLKKENLIQRIFQEVYLGETLFTEIYGETPTVVRQPGVIRHETALITTETLAALAQKMPLGIATGRPRAEAEHTLTRLGIDRHFQAMLTHDDVVAAGAHGKPDPWILHETVQRLSPAPKNPAYIGDTPDDIRAAKAAEFTAIGVLATATDPAALRAQFESLGADMMLESPDELGALQV